MANTEASVQGSSRHDVAEQGAVAQVENRTGDNQRFTKEM
jgi:hypothetical protein